MRSFARCQRAPISTVIYPELSTQNHSFSGQEFVKAAREQSVRYLQLKNMARNRLEHAFIEGASLWKSPRSYDRAVPCSTDRPGTQRLSASCSQLLQRSEKARLQWQLEEEFFSFEAKQRQLLH
jgi:hypothetical protein